MLLGQRGDCRQFRNNNNNNTLEYSDVSIEEEAIENALGDLPYQFAPVFDSRTVSPGGINAVTYEERTRHPSTF